MSKTIKQPFNHAPKCFYTITNSSVKRKQTNKQKQANKQKYILNCVDHAGEAYNVRTILILLL